MDAISNALDSSYGIADIDFGLSTFQQENRNSQGRNGAQSSSFADELQDTLTLSPEAQTKALQLSSREAAVHAHSQTGRHAEYDQHGQGYDTSANAISAERTTPSNEAMRRFPQGNQADMASVAAVYAQNIIPQDAYVKIQNRNFTPTTTDVQSLNATKNAYSTSALTSSIKPEQVASAYKTQAQMAARATALAPVTAWSRGISLQV